MLISEHQPTMYYLHVPTVSKQSCIPVIMRTQVLIFTNQRDK